MNVNQEKPNAGTPGTDAERSAERALAARVSAGDREALRRVYDQHAGTLLNLARRVLLDRDDAEDLVQDLFVSLPARLAGFRGDSALGTWLHRTAVNEALTRIRNGRRRLSLLERFFSSETERNGTSDPNRAGAAREAADELLAEFTPEVRALLWLKEGEGLDLKTVAESLGIPEGTAKSKLFRAREKARRILEEAGHGLEEFV